MLPGREGDRRKETIQSDLILVKEPLRKTSVVS